jgi:hypothetical protein
MIAVETRGMMMDDDNDNDYYLTGRGTNLLHSKSLQTTTTIQSSYIHST